MANMRLKKEMVAVLIEEIYDVMKNQEKFNEKRYENKLNELVNDDFIFDDVEQALNDEKDEILQTKYKVYDALMVHNSNEATSLFMAVWDQIKSLLSMVSILRIILGI